MQRIAERPLEYLGDELGTRQRQTLTGRALLGSGFPSFAERKAFLWARGSALGTSPLHPRSCPEPKIAPAEWLNLVENRSERGRNCQVVTVFVQ
jgi:hypothetical protein